MANPKVRCDYDSLNRVAQAFDQQADAARRTVGQLQSAMGVLEGGDWQGQGAAAFYREMNDKVLPTLQRLVKALEAGSQNSSQISQVMKQAEDEAARVLRGPNGAGASGAAGAGAAGTAAAGTSAFGGPGSGGSGSGAGGPSVSGPHDGESTGSGSASPTAKILSKFNSEAAQVAGKSPTLTAQLAALQALGWQVDSAPISDLLQFDPKSKHITIKSDLSPAAQANMLSQVVVDIGLPSDIGVVPTADMSRDEFVRQAVNGDLLSHGKVLLNSSVVRAEILGQGGPDIGLARNLNHEDQQDMDRIVSLYQSNRMGRDQATQRAADIFGGIVEPNAKINNYDARAARYRDFWDKGAADNGWGKNR